jgi:hypothetical protein
MAIAPLGQPYLPRIGVLGSWREILCPPWRPGVLLTKPLDIIAQAKKPRPFEPVIPQGSFPRFAH